MLRMARARSAGIDIDRRKEPRMAQEMEEDFKRGLMSLPRDVLRSLLLKASPELDDAKLDMILSYTEELKERDPLAVLHEDSLVGEKGGQFHVSRLAPNFEMAMYLAQATGSCIVTDSAFRWAEIRKAAGKPYPGLGALARNIGSSKFWFPQNAEGLSAFALDETFAGYPALMRDIFKYLANLGERGPKPNREAQLISRFGRNHAPAQAALKKARVPVKEARISCVFPSRGIQDNTVNRLLLMSSSERHLPSVPMAFFIEERAAERRPK